METITDISQLDLDKRYSYADYLKWQLQEYVELFRGKIMRMSPAPLRAHQDISGNIFHVIRYYLRGKTCRVYHAPFDVWLSPQMDAKSAGSTLVQPDICVICDPEKLVRQGCAGAPDTIIEILSQGNVYRDIREKYNLYESFGVPEYWIVAPGERTVVVHLLNAQGVYELQGEYSAPGPIPVHSLPGFELQWEEIFENVP